MTSGERARPGGPTGTGGWSAGERPWPGGPTATGAWPGGPTATGDDPHARAEAGATGDLLFAVDPLAVARVAPGRVGTSEEGAGADPRTLAHELRARGVRYVSATVVRAERPTSAHAGDSAVVLADGAIVGFVGGACAESSVRLHALRALRVGSPVLLRITPSDGVDVGTSPPGAVPSRAADAEASTTATGPDGRLRPGVPAASAAVVPATPDARPATPPADAPPRGDGDTSAEVRVDPGDGGAVTVANPCISGGTLEIFLEPVVPAPLVVVHGDAPVAQALCTVGRAAGFVVERLGGRAGAGSGEAATALQPAGGVTVPPAGGGGVTVPPAGGGGGVTGLPASGGGGGGGVHATAEGGGARSDLAGALAVVVATHGRDELRLLQAALEAQVPYIGLVASPRRGAAVLEQLAVPDEARARIRTPAGLDLGARRPGEIALSIWAEIVAVAAKRSVAASAAGPGNEPALAPAVVPGPTPSGSSPTPAPPGPAPPVASPAPAVASGPIAPPSPVVPAVVGSSGAPGWPVAADVAIDPVCGMEVAAVAASAQCMRDGVRYYFCGSGCQQAFEADPGAFAAR